MVSKRTRIWIDFENAPHVLVLAPIMRCLREAGYERFVLTARDFSYTVGLAERFGFDVRVAGLPGPGRTTATKVGRIGLRAADLIRLVGPLRNEIALALSHGSRSQLLASRCLGIPAITLDDYEPSFQGFNVLARYLLCPDVIPSMAWGRSAPRVMHYGGLKEEIYLSRWSPSEYVPDFLTRAERRVKVLLRPEAPLAHYRSPVSERVQSLIMEKLSEAGDLLVVLLPRSGEQGVELSHWCEQRGVECYIPESTPYGPDLISHMDLVIGGGGTMTREAAVLGVPAYSFFSGQWGAVDQHLVAEGRLNCIAGVADVGHIPFTKRRSPLASVSDRALRSVVRLIAEGASELARR